MFKKIVKFILLVMMIIGTFIVVVNFTEADIQGGEMKVVTYYKNVPACYGPPKDCNDFTQPTE
jgi:hypothetical protein